MVDYWLSIAQGKFNCYADLGYPGYLGCPDYPYGCLDYLDYLHKSTQNIALKWESRQILRVGSRGTSVVEQVCNCGPELATVANTIIWRLRSPDLGWDIPSSSSGHCLRWIRFFNEGGGTEGCSAQAIVGLALSWVVAISPLFFFRINKTTINQEDFEKKRSRAAIKAQALKELEKEKEARPIETYLAFVHQVQY